MFHPAELPSLKSSLNSRVPPPEPDDEELEPPELEELEPPPDVDEPELLEPDELELEPPLEEPGVPVPLLGLYRGFTQ